MPDKTGRMTDQERMFVAAMVETADPLTAARAAGYAQPTSAATKLMQRADVARAVWEAAEVRLRGEGAAVGIGTLIRIARNEKAPFNAQVAAAGHLVKLNGYGDAMGASAGAKPLSEMTRAELSEARAKAVLILADLEAGGDGRTIEHAALPAPGGLFD